MKKNKISIIVPVYNCEELIQRCINSLLKQTYKNIEILLIDDGSKDNSGKICDEYEKKDSRIKVFHKENGGVSSSRNLGLKKMTGNYFMFVDSDDYLDFNSIESLINNLKKDDEIIGLCYKEIFDNKEKIKRRPIIYTRDDFIVSILNNETPGCCWGILYNSNLQKKENLFFDSNTNYMEDTLFLINYLIIADIAKVNFIDLAYYNYYVNPSSLTHSNISINTIKGYHYSLDKINDLTNYIYDEFVTNDKIFLLEACCTLINNEVGRLELIKYFKKNLKLFKYTGKNLKLKIFYHIIRKKNFDLWIKKYFKLKEKIKKISKG